MKSKVLVVSVGLCIAGAAGLLPLSGCSITLLKNLTTESQGSVTFIFINDTPYRASFSFGTYDAFDRTDGAEIEFDQLRLEARLLCNHRNQR